MGNRCIVVVVRCALMGSQREARATEGDGGIVRAQASARAAPGGSGALRHARGLTRMPGRPACGARLVPLLSPSIRAGGGRDRGAPTPIFFLSLENRHHATRTEVLLDGGWSDGLQLAKLCWILVEGLCSSLLVHNF